MYGTDNDSTTKIAAVVQEAVSLRCITCTGKNFKDLFSRAGNIALAL
jgi:hypothetical protein